jgi:uncharacterized protein YggE
MNRARHILTLAWALAACASPGAQTPAGAAMPVERIAPNIYELVPEQLAVSPAQNQETPFIEVSGTASVEVPANEAQISFAMETRAADAGVASAANAEAMARVFAALRAGGFAGLRLETFGYSLQPQYATDDTRVRSIVGYAAFNNVRATVGDVDAVGRLIDVAVAAGANRVASITFSASDTESGRARALAEAVANARAQAIVIATALGYELGAPLTIYGGAQRPMPIMFDAMRSVQERVATTPIEAGAQTVDANVTIRFALGREVAPR